MDRTRAYESNWCIDCVIGNLHVGPQVCIVSLVGSWAVNAPLTEALTFNFKYTA